MVLNERENWVARKTPSSCYRLAIVLVLLSALESQRACSPGHNKGYLGIGIDENSWE